MIVGLDVRPMLFSRTGIGRYVAELIRALGCLPEGPDLRLYGDSFRGVLDPQRVAAIVSASGAKLVRRRIPGRVTRLLGQVGYGVERRLGAIELFHYTDLVFPPVRGTRTVVTVQDLVFEIDASFHGPEFRRDVPARLRRVVDAAARVIVPSQETFRQVAERYAVPEERLVLIPHGAEHMQDAPATPVEQFEEWARTLGIRRPYLLSVGTIEPRKNHLRLLAAFERFCRSRPHMLVLVGGFGWLDEAVRERLLKLRPTGRVVHLQGLDDRMLPALYDHAELNVYPSLYEGFGLPVLEGMARGVATVTTRRGSLAEVGGSAVRYFEAEEEGSLLEALEELADSEELRVRLGQAGRSRAAQFTWAGSAREHLRVYREVAGR